MDENITFGLFLLAPLVCGGLIALFVRYRRRRNAPAGWAWVLAGNILVLFFLLSLLFDAEETYYRFFYDKTDSLAYTKVTRAWYRRYYHENAAGFRDNIEYGLAVPPGKRRITFVGDSFLVGHGVKNVEDRFANLIRKSHPDWEIHALGQPGYDTGDELKLLGVLYQDYQLDQVVLVYNLNDVADIVPEWQVAIRRIFADANRRSWLRNNSYFVDTLYHRFRAAHDPYMRNYFDFVRTAYEGPIWEQQKERLKRFRDLVQSRGGRLLVVTFPFLHAVGPNYGFQPVHAQLDAFWSGLHVAHLDLLPVYQHLAPEEITVDKYDAHPNEYAHALAAKSIQQFLEEQLRAAPPPKLSKSGLPAAPAASQP